MISNYLKGNDEETKAKKFQNEKEKKNYKRKLEYWRL